MRLLIVEDSKLIRKVTRLAFPPKEHELHEAEDGQAALDLVDAATEPFDAILLDLNMPRMDAVSLSAPCGSVLATVTHPWCSPRASGRPHSSSSMRER